MPPDPSDRADGVPPLATGLTVNPTPALLALLAAGLRARQALLATAESCTGGLIAGACTDLAGSSDWFERGLVTYSNRAKAELLGVPEPVLAAHGAVSEPVALAMAEGLLVRAPVAITAAVTGIAGPGGGSAEKPVGLVWLAWAWRAADGSVRTEALRQVFPGDRAAVRAATVACALQGVLDRLERLAPPAPAPAGASRPAPAAGATPGRNPATRGAGP